MKTDILANVKRCTKVGVSKAKKHSPEILMIAGAVGVVTAAVMACKATLKLEETINNGKKKIDETKETYSSAIDDKKSPEHKDYVKVITADYASLGLQVAKLYAPSVIIGAAGLATVFVSNDILRKRNAALLAACTATETAFRNYRANVVEAYGEEVDRDMKLGIKTKQAEFTEVDKKGKEKTTAKTISVVENSLTGYSDYARFYDEACEEWTKDPEYNLLFLRQREREANIRLKAYGYLFLNDVYDMLGIPKTQAGQVVGWIYDPENPIGDNEVDFGIYDIYKERNRDFVNGYEPVILLDFNVDGVIVDKI